MFVKVFVMTHKEFPVPPDPVYIPLQVGRSLSNDLGFLGDHTGDNISDKNRSFCELTGMYWIWKNLKTEGYVGVCHYRRYPVNEKNLIMTEEEYLSILKEYEFITTKKLTLNFSYYDGYAANHNIRDLDVTGEVIREKFPEYYPAFLRLVHQNQTYFGNIIITSKENFDAYASWLFAILFETEERIDISEYDDYHKRVFGFLSEFLLTVWLDVNRLSVYEIMVGMTSEKYETMDVKDAIAAYFAKKDLVGAKKYLQDTLQKRPDILMEASDITGELKLAMQMIATFEREYQESKSALLDSVQDFKELVKHFEKVNAIVRRQKNLTFQTEDLAYLQSRCISKTMLQIAIELMVK